MLVKQGTLLLKIEGTYGVEEAPAAGDAILVEGEVGMSYDAVRTIEQAPEKATLGKEEDLIAGNLVRIKMRDIADKGYMPQYPAMKDADDFEHGYQKLLFGQQAMPSLGEIVEYAEGNTLSLVLTEGELDAMSFASVGWIGLSLPEGAQGKKVDDGSSPHDQWIEHDYEWMQHANDIVLSLDSDEQGQTALEQLLPRLRRSRCRVMKFPEGYKDGNDCLIDELSMLDLVNDAVNLDPPELKRPGDFADEIWYEFHPGDRPNPIPACKSPWTMPFEFREGEFTIWHGYNSHGKTVCMTHCAIHMAHQQEKVLIASLEMPAKKTFKNAVRMVVGHGNPTREELDAAVAWLDQYFLVFDHVGTVKHSDLLDLYKYAVEKYGVKHFMCDSLMMLDGVRHDDYEVQTTVCHEQIAFAQEHQVHTHMVCHSKKPDARRPAARFWPTRFDISGHANLSNIPDNVIVVWRNEKKEAIVEEAEYVRSQGNNEAADQMMGEVEGDMDAMVEVQKQRHGEGSWPKKRLHFDKGPGSWQFLEDGQGKIEYGVSEA